MTPVGLARLAHYPRFTSFAASVPTPSSLTALYHLTCQCHLTCHIEDPETAGTRIDRLGGNGRRVDQPSRTRAAPHLGQVFALQGWPATWGSLWPQLGQTQCPPGPTKGAPIAPPPPRPLGGGPVSSPRGMICLSLLKHLRGHEPTSILVSNTINVNRI